ncbi:MAG: transcriptional regulator [Nitrosopumilus sp.]|nr:transcriptional regulator [Nitrosopumilus sp.]MDH3823497.1 transcriptional regulator [Nitrosopumilus sp.]MDH3834325.1 transcriptional regulator [Nitrosopumilus sp.]
MNGLDQFLASSLENVIKQNLGKNTVKKIQNRLFEKYGISLIQSIKEFQKIDAVLKEFFGSGANGIEVEFLEDVCKIKSRDKTNKKCTIKDEKISQLILESFRDDNKISIINSIIDEPKIISNILNENKIPQTSGYRKINQMIIDGLIVPSDSTIIEGKKVVKYKSLFEGIQIKIVKNKITVEVELSSQNFDNSSILQTIHN